MSRAETATAGAAAERIDMVIVGAGFGGMYATYKFREMGLNIFSI